MYLYSNFHLPMARLYSIPPYTSVFHSTPQIRVRWMSSRRLARRSERVQLQRVVVSSALRTGSVLREYRTLQSCQHDYSMKVACKAVLTLAVSIRVTLGKSPPQVRATLGKSPPQVRATLGKSPPQVRATLGKSPPQVRATLGKGPPQVRVTSGKSPPQVRATLGKGPPQIRAHLRAHLR